MHLYPDQTLGTFQLLGKTGLNDLTIFSTRVPRLTVEYVFSSYCKAVANL